MANYYTQFSCELDVASPENLARALALYAELSDSDDREESCSLGFSLIAAPEPQSTVLWIHTEESGDPEHVVIFVQKLCEVIALSGRWGFDYSNICSRPLVEAFGGGAYVIDLATGDLVASNFTNEWVTRLVEEGGPDA